MLPMYQCHPVGSSQRERDTPGSDLGLEYLTATGRVFRLVGLRLGY
jgi:hypothetical protein